MTKYYGVTGNKTASNQSDKTLVKDKAQKSVISTDTTGLTKMKKEAGELKTSAENLSKGNLWKKKDGNYDMDKIADAADVKSLFSGNYSYASQVATKASGINSAALRNTSMYSSEGTYSSFSQSMFNYWA